MLRRVGRLFARFTIRSRFLFGAATLAVLFLLSAFNGHVLSEGVQAHSDRLLELGKFDESLARGLNSKLRAVAGELTRLLGSPGEYAGKPLVRKLNEALQAASSYRKAQEQSEGGYRQTPLGRAVDRIPLLVAELQRLTPVTTDGLASAGTTPAIRPESESAPANDGVHDPGLPGRAGVAARVAALLPFIDELDHIAAVLDQETDRRVQGLLGTGNQAVRSLERARFLNSLISAIGLVAVLLAVLAGLYLLRHPLQGVVKGLQGVARHGDLSTELPIDGRDELSTLSSAFNSLVANIAQVVESVERAADRLTYQSVSLSNLTEWGRGRAVLQSKQATGTSVEIRSLAEYLEGLGIYAESIASKARQVEFESGAGSKSLARLLEGDTDPIDRIDELRDGAGDCATCIDSGARRTEKFTNLGQGIKHALHLAIETSGEIHELSDKLVIEMRSCIDQAQCIDQELQAIGAISDEAVSASQATAVLGEELRDAARQLNRLIATFTAP